MHFHLSRRFLFLATLLTFFLTSAVFSPTAEAQGIGNLLKKTKQKLKDKVKKATQNITNKVNAKKQKFKDKVNAKKQKFKDRVNAGKSFLGKTIRNGKSAAGKRIRDAMQKGRTKWIPAARKLGRKYGAELGASLQSLKSDVREFVKGPVAEYARKYGPLVAASVVLGMHTFAPGTTSAVISAYNTILPQMHAVQNANTREEKLLHGIGMGIAIITQVGLVNKAIVDDKANALYNGLSVVANMPGKNGQSMASTFRSFVDRKMPYLKGTQIYDDPIAIVASAIGSAEPDELMFEMITVPSNGQQVSIPDRIAELDSSKASANETVTLLEAMGNMERASEPGCGMICMAGAIGAYGNLTSSLGGK